MGNAGSSSSLYLTSAIEKAAFRTVCLSLSELLLGAAELWLGAVPSISTDISSCLLLAEGHLPRD